MMRNTWQGRQGRILSPVPDATLSAAAALWRGHFGGKNRFDPARGVVAIGAEGQVMGVMGLRDGKGGFYCGGDGLLGRLYRPAPPTRDLVIDGIAVSERRIGVGQALVEYACKIAENRHFPGLRAEVRGSNHGALVFYDRLGFMSQGAGRYGLPWWGQVHILRRDAVLTDAGLTEDTRDPPQ
ncbi:GNAT family N-acetyltransferase [Paracoccus sp. JM45]|nr:GNAT family N-acetyltransferase [Paracoccus sp. JM45]